MFKPDVFRQLLNPVACLSLLLILAGCGSASIPPTNGAIPAAAKTVAVVSLLPDTLSISYVGITVFGNKNATFPAEFDTNEYVRNVGEQLLSPRYNIVPIKLNSDAIFAAVKSTPPNTWMGPLPAAIFTDPVIQAQFKAHVKPGTADLIVVCDGTYPAAPTGLCAGSQGFRQPDVFWLASHFEVFDGNTFEEITSSDGAAVDNIWSKLTWDGEPYDSLSAETKTSMADVEHQAIYAYVKSVLMRANLTQ